MQWLQRLFRARPVSSMTIQLSVRCDHCGRTIATRVNLLNDLSELDEPGGGAQYLVRKTLVDDGCFRRITAELRYSRDRRLVSAEISGGTLLTPIL